MKFSIKKICSKEKVGRLIIGLSILLVAIFLFDLRPIISYVSIFIGIYLIITGLLGSCLLFAIWKE